MVGLCFYSEAYNKTHTNCLNALAATNILLTFHIFSTYADMVVSALHVCRSGAMSSYICQGHLVSIKALNSGAANILRKS